MKSEDLLNAVLSCSPDGYIVSNEFGKITLVNSVIENITGWDLKELLNQDVTKIYSLPERIGSSTTNLLNNIKPQVALLFRRDGTKLTLKARQIELSDNLGTSKKFSGYLTIFHTEAPFDPNLEKAQFEFISTVSHELRTPLTSIKGFAETLIRAGEKLSGEVKLKYLNIIREQADRLTRLVENLLDTSSLESQNYHLTVRALDIEKYVIKVCESLTAKASNRKLINNIQKNIPLISVDPDRIEQILTNLIDNAIKYSPEGSIIKIDVSSDSEQKDKVKIEISDEGIGIGESDLPKIFSKFGRLDNPLTRQTQGTGLGLFITKSLVLALNGDIYVNSVPGKTTFTVILPAVIPEQGIPLPSSDELSQARGRINN